LRNGNLRNLSDWDPIVIIEPVPRAAAWLDCRRPPRPSASMRDGERLAVKPAGASVPGSGQVAQVVERSPEKAGVGGSTPSLATIIPKDLGVFARFLQPKVQPKIDHWIVSVSR
jgi:hypothetical protein